MKKKYQLTFVLLPLMGLMLSSSLQAVASTSDRLNLLERTTSNQSQAVIRLQEALSNTQREVDQLRGQLETTQYQLNKLQESQRQLYLLLNGDSGQTTAPVAATSSVSNAQAPQNQLSDAGNEEQDYKNALTLIIEKQNYEQGLIALQNFVKKYPNSTRYAGNAHYWLGQVNYSQGKQDQASYYFAIVVKSHANSPKAADAMYKLGLIFQGKKELAKAKALFTKLVQMYPDSASAQQAKSRLAEL